MTGSVIYLVSWNCATMTAVITIDDDADQYVIMVPSTNNTSEKVISHIKDMAKTIAQNPDIREFHGKQI